MNSVLKKITAVCVAAFSVLVFTFTAGAAEPVIVGIVHREDFAYAKMMKHAFEMALEEINNAGGIKGQPDAIFMVSYLDDATMLVCKAKEMKVQSLLCGGAGGFTHASFCRKTGNASENMVTATLWSPAAKFAMAKAFYDRYVERYSIQPDYHAAEAYSALLVSADALNRSRSLASDDIRAALNDTRMETPFGSVEFKDYGPYKRQNASATQVFQIKNGNFETIWPPVLATSTYTAPSN